MQKTLLEKIKQNKKRTFIISAIILLIFLILFFLIFFKKEYEVKFNSNNGSEIVTVKVRENDKVEKPEDPTKEGYSFAGWYYNDELFDFNTLVKHDITLQAEWEELNNAEVEGITLNATELSLLPDGTAILNATLLPENAKQVKLIWSSSDESIATVDENGNIKALKEGTVTITVATEDGKFTATCTIKVTQEIVAIEGITISGPKELKVGETIKLNALISPDNATNKNVNWSSSNSYVARVDQNGNVRGLRAGTVTITVKTVDGEKQYSYTITVKSTESNNSSTETAPNAPANPSKPSNQTTTTPGGQTNTGTGTTPNTPNTPNTPTTPTEPSNPNTPTNPSKPEDSKPSTVEVTSVSLDKTNVTLTEGETLTLTATVNPTNATDKTVTWSSNDSNIASVVNGKVTAKKAGTVTITVTTANGKTATCTITVKEKEAVYVITLTGIQTPEGIFQYEPSITKDGVALPKSEYNSVTYNGKTLGFKSKILADSIDKSVTEATIHLKNGKSVKATVGYAVRIQSN